LEFELFSSVYWGFGGWVLGLVVAGAEVSHSYLSELQG